MKASTMRQNTGSGVTLKTRAPHHTVIPNGTMRIQDRAATAVSTVPWTVRMTAAIAETFVLTTTIPAR